MYPATWLWKMFSECGGSANIHKAALTAARHGSNSTTGCMGSRKRRSRTHSSGLYSSKKGSHHIQLRIRRTNGSRQQLECSFLTALLDADTLLRLLEIVSIAKSR
jgi:hypothetical protein